MYLLIEIRHDVHIQCHENYIEVKKINYMLEIDILRKLLTKMFGVLKGGL